MTESLSRKDAFWVFNGLPSVGPITLGRLRERFDGDPVAVLRSKGMSFDSIEGVSRKAAEALSDWRNRFDLAKEKETAKRMGADFISMECDRYAGDLKEIADPPIGLYSLGGYDFSKPGIAIVGSRKTTAYGRGLAKEFGFELARRGYCIVSGMARGIDAFAHQGALEASEGSTVAVLGCGLDIVYPPENIDLYKEIPERGSVVSEFVFRRKADRQTFPMRNRIVSGLSKAVLVIESDDSGGSMITARFAGEQGRLLCAIPGRVDQSTSRGCHQLIRDGATLVRSVDDLLEELAYDSGVPQMGSAFYKGEANARMIALSDAERHLVGLFAGGEALTVDDIGSLLGIPVADASTQALMLELKGALARRLDGAYETTRLVGMG